jgi:polyisoprenoid-binding protein YceI
MHGSMPVHLIINNLNKRNMRKLTAIVIVLMISAGQIFAQKFITRNGHISFYSEAPLENIEAHNYQVTSVLDTETGEMAFSVLIKGFEFEKALMQEHFNEKYLHSDEYPKSTFKGSIKNIEDVDLTEPGTYEVTVEGELTIHGVTHEVSHEGTVEVKDGEIFGNATFPVRLADYDITIPSVVKDNIAKVVDVTVKVNYKPYKK